MIALTILLLIAIGIVAHQLTFPTITTTCNDWCIQARLFRERTRPYRVAFNLMSRQNTPLVRRLRGYWMGSICFGTDPLTGDENEIHEMIGIYREAARPRRIRLRKACKLSNCDPLPDQWRQDPCYGQPEWSSVWAGSLTIPTRDTASGAVLRPRRVRGAFYMTTQGEPIYLPGDSNPQYTRGDFNSIVGMDVQHAARFRYVALYPIPQSLSIPGVPASAPWNWIGDCVRTYKIPCYDNTVYPFSPNRYVGADHSAAIPPGLSAIIGQSSGLAWPGWIHAYFYPDNGAPADTTPAMENIFRFYHGSSAHYRIRWEDDPQSRGWWVEYYSVLCAWLAVDTAFEVFPYQAEPRRFAPWFDVQVIAKIYGDITDVGFRQFVESQSCGFGVRVTPRYQYGNDVSARCGYDSPTRWPRVTCSPHIYPPETIQDGLNPQHPDVPGTPPSLAAGLGYSRWYVSYNDFTQETVLSIWPGYENDPIHPSIPFPVEIKRERLAPGGEVISTDYGWTVLQFGDFIGGVEA